MSNTQVEVMEYMKTELRKIFPTSGLFIRPRTIIGQTNIHFFYMNAAKPEDCVSGIPENDPAFMAFAIWNDRDGSFYVDAPATHGNVLRNAGIKRFNKIKGSTEMECAVKLVAWMSKHSTAFLALGLRR